MKLTLQGPVFINTTVEHDQLVRREGMDRGVREHLGEPSLESLHLTIDSIPEGEVHDLGDVLVQVPDRNSSVSTIWNKLDIRIARQSEIERHAANGHAKDPDVANEIGSLVWRQNFVFLQH